MMSQPLVLTLKICILNVDSRPLAKLWNTTLPSLTPSHVTISTNAWKFYCSAWEIQSCPSKTNISNMESILTIGGFESAFLAYLKALYIFDKLDMLFNRQHQNYYLPWPSNNKMAHTMVCIYCKQRISNSWWKSGAWELSPVPSHTLSHLCLVSEKFILSQ